MRSMPFKVEFKKADYESQHKVKLATLWVKFEPTVKALMNISECMLELVRLVICSSIGPARFRLDF